MKTKEFIKKIEELGYEVSTYDDFIEVVYEEKIVYLISNKIMYTFDNVSIKTFQLGENERAILFKLVVEYASTPIEEREETKKYFLKHKWMVGNYAGDFYLGEFRNKNSDKVTRYSLVIPYIAGDSTSTIKREFTKKEIEELKNKLDTDLADFELVEVEEWTIKVLEN